MSPLIVYATPISQVPYNDRLFYKVIRNDSEVYSSIRVGDSIKLYQDKNGYVRPLISDDFRRKLLEPTRNPEPWTDKIWVEYDMGEVRKRIIELEEREYGCILQKIEELQTQAKVMKDYIDDLKNGGDSWKYNIF